MYRQIAKLVIYRNLEKDSILLKLADICERFVEGDYHRETLVNDIYAEINKLLDISTQYGFDHNLWHCYLAYILATRSALRWRRWALWRVRSTDLPRVILLFLKSCLIMIFPRWRESSILIASVRF